MKLSTNSLRLSFFLFTTSFCYSMAAPVATDDKKEANNLKDEGNKFFVAQNVSPSLPFLILCSSL
jgi:hypothetical protein